MEVKTPPKRVLVVDDEAHIANTLAAMLRDRGYEAAAAYDAVGGLAHCEACPPDLIISDVVMPGMNGVQFAERLKRVRYHAPTILLGDAQATNGDIHVADTVLARKNCSAQELLERIKVMSARKRGPRKGAMRMPPMEQLAAAS